MIRLPVNNQWSQPNNSDKFGSLAFTKNINLDEEGYIKLSPRMVTIAGEEENEDFGHVVGIARVGSGDLQVATSSNANFKGDVSPLRRAFTEDSGTAEPALTVNSHARLWQNLWFASTTDAVLSKAANGTASATWTSRITSLTSGVPHYLEVFKSRNNLCVTNGNVVKQYDTAYSGTQDLTLPADFQATRLAYNNDQLGIATRTGNATIGQNSNAFFFVWDGTMGAANAGYDTGSDMCLALIPYKSSFLLLVRDGRLLYFNGGGFDQLAAFPFYFDDKQLGTLTSNIVFGDSMSVDGDVVYINIGLGDLNSFGRKQEEFLPNNPSGIWCFDPEVGLYHRWSPSMSKAYVNHVAHTDIDTGTDTLTISAGVYGLQTIPATGNPARLTSTVGIGGLVESEDYFIIRVSDTEFKLAETKELALAGAAIDITSATSGSNYFWMYDLVDYGVSIYDNGASVALLGETKNFGQDIFAGTECIDIDSTTTYDVLCMAVPWLENRGWFVTPKVFPAGTEDTTQHFTIKYRPLKTGDAIVVKYRTEDIEGLPTSIPSELDDEVAWTGDHEFTTTADLSEAMEYLDAGNELECELTSGAGAGQMVQITSIDEEDGTYAVVLDEDVLGATTGRFSTFSINNWKVAEIITENGKGYAEVPITQAAKWIQFKVELRGDGTTIEQIDIIDSNHKA